MADFYVKTFPIGSDWAYRNGDKKYILEIDEYELRGLKWLMELVYNNEYKEHNLNTGDWVGQIRHALVDGTL